MAGLMENKANLNSSFSLVEVEVWVELGNIFFKPVEVSCLSHGKTGHVFLTKSAKCYRLSDMLKVGKLNF